MYIMSFKKFLEFYNKYKRTPNQIKPPKNKLNENQLLSAYARYERGMEKKSKSEDKKLKEIYKKIDIRDENKCRLIHKLTAGELAIFKENAHGFDKIIDHAHIFGKGAYPHMKYLKENIVLLNRYSHTMLDSKRSPINGKSISNDKWVKWWIRIVGNLIYNKLKEIK